MNITPFNPSIHLETSNPKMTHTSQPQVFSVSDAFSVPPPSRAAMDQRDSRGPGRFDIHDAEGHVPEIICRVMLGLCLAYTLFQVISQLAGF